jgi:hypothetical protein
LGFLVNSETRHREELQPNLLERFDVEFGRRACEFILEQRNETSLALLELVRPPALVATPATEHRAGQSSLRLLKLTS